MAPPTNMPTAVECSNGHSNGHSNGVMQHRPIIAKSLKRPISNISNNNGAAPVDAKRAKFENGQDFLEKLIPIMKDAMQQFTKEESRVVEFLHPHEVEQRINLSLSEGPTSNDQILETCKDIIRYSVKTGHPHFFNQLFGGFNHHGLGGAWLTECLNPSIYTYEVAPVFTIMEKMVMKEMMKMIGWTDGDGIFCPGGSMSNMYAINLARYQKFPEVKTEGLFGLPKLCILTSEKSHYSIRKGAGFLGLGMNNVLAVKTDSMGRMIPEELEKRIVQAKAEGCAPFMVNCTAGSTVLGAYDPVEPIADICEKHSLWLHVDGAWGGACLMSDKLKHKVKGIHRADSMTWNPHKMMNAVQQTACFFTRHKSILAEGHSANAKYLFQQDKFYDVSYDTGDKSIQCGRRVDVLKLWTMWKSKGSIQFAKDIENIFEQAQYLAKKLASTEGFRMVIAEPECTNVCFYYIPPSLRGQEETAEWWEKVSKVAPAIKKRMTEQGTMLCGYQPDGHLVNFFRMVVVNHDVTNKDMDFVCEEIERLGKDL